MTSSDANQSAGPEDTTRLAAERLDGLRASAGRLAGVVERLGPDDLRAQAYPTKWNVSDVLSHLGSGGVISRLRVDTALDGGELDPHPVWDEWNAKTPEGRATDVLAVDRELLERVARLTPEEQARFRMAFGPFDTDLAGFLGLRLNEHAVHSWDVNVTFDPAATIPADAVVLVIDSVSMVTRFAAKPTGAERSITVRTSAPARSFEVALAPDSATVTETDGSAPPDLELPSEAFIRLVYGRLDPDHTPAFQGDPDALDELRRAFPGF